MLRKGKKAEGKTKITSDVRTFSSLLIEPQIAVHFKIFVDQFCLFFIKFMVQNTSVVQIRD